MTKDSKKLSILSNLWSLKAMAEYPPMHLFPVASTVTIEIKLGTENSNMLAGRRPQRRSHRRFAVNAPVNARFKLGNSVTELRATTINVSIGGVLLQTEWEVPVGSKVRFTMIVRGHPILGSTQIAGEGEVVRVHADKSESGFAIAVECRPSIARVRRIIAASFN